MGGGVLWIRAAWNAQRGALFSWAPVCLAVGTGSYFALPVEPWPWHLWLTGLCGLALVLGQRWLPTALVPPVMALGLVALGFGLAGARAHLVSGAVLDYRYYGPVEGRIVNIDRSASDAVRLTLDRVVLERTAPKRTPRRVRVSLHGDQGFTRLAPGVTVILTGHLGPPGGPVEPGGFDFQRHAWFLGLGAVGYTRNPVLTLDPAAAGELRVFAARMWLSERVRRLLPDDSGAFAAAIMSGDRSAMDKEMVQALRDTNLAHLLAISGLHMGLLVGFVFWALRLGLLLVPPVRHRWPVKKIAAAGALVSAAGYLALSGGNVATERAFTMVAVALTAVIFDRRALSLRSVALAALIILCLQPEALLSPGFQMSFAATVALVACYEVLSDWQRGREVPRWVQPVIALVFSSVVAGFATAPVGMAHFNRSAVYGLAANLVAMPVMGALVMPMGVVAALLMPMGLDWMPLSVMSLGLDWVLTVARWFAGLPGAVRPVPAPGPYELPLLAFGGVFLALWRGPSRVLGLVPLCLAVALWIRADRPVLLIAGNGMLVGVMTEQGRALSRPSGAGFIAENWLENDGLGQFQAQAAGLWPGDADNRLWRIGFAGGEIVHVQGVRAGRRLQTCTADQIVVSSVDLPDLAGCRVLDPARLRRTGSIAVWRDEDGLRWQQAAPEGHWRLWHGGTRQDR